MSMVAPFMGRHLQVVQSLHKGALFPHRHGLYPSANCGPAGREHGQLAKHSALQNAGRNLTPCRALQYRYRVAPRKPIYVPRLRADVMSLQPPLAALWTEMDPQPLWSSAPRDTSCDSMRSMACESTP